MLESIEGLIKLIQQLPETALWILAGYALYKLSIIASIYGVLRLLINRLFDWLGTRQEKGKKVNLEGIVIESCYHELVAQISRLKSTYYIHSDGVDKLRKALDMYEEHVRSINKSLTTKV